MAWAVRTGVEDQDVDSFGVASTLLDEATVASNLTQVSEFTQKLYPLPVWEMMVHVNLTNAS